MDKKDMKNAQQRFAVIVELHEVLASCLKTEQEALLAADIDTLWATSREKELLCREILAGVDALADLLPSRDEEGRIQLHQVPGQLSGAGRQEAHDLMPRLVRAQSRIEALKAENIQLVQTSLGFVDDLLQTLTGVEKTPPVYGRRFFKGASPRAAFVSQEV